MELDPFNTKRIILFGGWGKSGLAVLALCDHLGIDVFVLDDNPPPGDLLHKPAGLVTGDIVDFAQQENIEAAVVSPGFALSRSEIKDFKKTNLPLLGEGNFGNLFLDGILKIAVTGTDGKSSVVHFCNELLNKIGLSSQAVGNYGRPLCLVALELQRGQRPDVLVIELSSYQLENITGFDFDVACWTNFAPDHENRYQGLSDYFGAKANLLACTKGPKLIGNFKALVSGDKTHTGGAWQNYLGRFAHEERTNENFQSFLEKLYRYDWGRLVFLGETFSGYDYQNVEFVFPKLRYKNEDYDCPNESKIVHRNLQTVLTIIEEAVLFLETESLYPDLLNTLAELPQKLVSALPVISQLPHRQEFIAEKNGVKFYNDSKATTVQAVAAALQSFEAPIHLLLGGRSKGADFRPLLVYRDNVTYYTYGEAATEICEQLADVHPPQHENIKAAILSAAHHAKPGEIVLLSPACTSWDEFKSFEERGQFFRKVVESL